MLHTGRMTFINLATASAFAMPLPPANAKQAACNGSEYQHHPHRIEVPKR